ncbi:hypothetical protein [Streptomyces viridosporus]|uniref:hypothetical protein n=1 Tax=Streptomyces viridosporus TaxID=67581 RepID=UPI0036FB1374
MEQAKATTPTAPTDQDTARSSYQRARALADQLVTRVTVLPDSIETRRELGTDDDFGIRLHFGTGLAAGRGVLETATIAETEVLRDDIPHGGVWIEARATLEGIPLIARALTDTADADQLLQSADPDTTTTQPIPTPPTVGTSPSSVVVPALLPLAMAVTPVTPVTVVGEQGGEQ